MNTPERTEERLAQLEREHRNLRMLLAAIVDDAGGEVLVPFSVLVSASEESLTVEDRSWDSDVVVRTDAAR